MSYYRNESDRIYLDVAEQIIEFGTNKDDRTGTGTTSLFGQQMVFDLTADKMPLLTTKKLHLRSIIHELIWFLQGKGNIAYLKENDVTIWDEWADENGNLGPVYGVQWRHWDDTRIVDDAEVSLYESRGFVNQGELTSNKTMTGRFVMKREIDQIANLIGQLRTNPDSRRLILTAWNPSVIEEQALPPCHSFVQFNTRHLTTQDKITIAYGRIQGVVTSGYRNLTPDEETFMKSGVFANDGQGAYFDVDLDEELLHRLVPAERGLSCQLYQRSADIFLGVPFNIASYALLTHMIAKCVGMESLEFIHSLGDVHLYSNHQDQMHEQLEREGVECQPVVVLAGNYNDPGQFRFEDIQVINYESQPAIKAPVAV